MTDPGDNDFLSLRLKAVHDMAVEGIGDLNERRIVDVGSDHGHLPIFALINDGFASAVLTDIHEEPAKRSEQTLRMYGLNDRAAVYCTDGLDGVELDHGDIVVMAGLGGNNMIDIMSRVIARGNADKLKSIIWCLQPQKSSDKLRLFLSEKGFNITDENICEDRGKYYLIIRARFDGIKRDLSLEQRYYGPVILERVRRKEPQVSEYKRRLDKRFELSAQSHEDIRMMLEQRRDTDD